MSDLAVLPSSERPPNPEPLLVSDALLQQAEQVCKRRLANDPDSRTLLASLAEIHRKQGKLREAATVYKRLTHVNPEDREAEYMHAILNGTEAPTLPPGIRPSPFVLIKDFLPPAFHETLFPFALSVQEKLVPALVAGELYKPETRESLHLPGEWEVKKRFHQRVRSIIPQVRPRLHVPPFDIGEIEVKVRAYLDGHFFRVHMDCPPQDEKIANRTISYVYFFHKPPKAYTGGDLLLFDSDPDVEHTRFTTAGFTRVVPGDNSIVLFPSAYWHSVIPVRCPSKQYQDSRFVINGHISKCAPRPAVTAVADNGDRVPPAHSTDSEAQRTAQ